MDLAARTCRRGEHSVELTAREFALLAYLALHADEVVSKQDLLRHVWAEHGDFDANVVEVYVSYLRRKIDVPFDRASIETVRGAGYRLVSRA